MKKLPLYSDRKQEIDRTQGRGRNPSCTSCKRHTGTRTVCIAPDMGDASASSAGTILVIGESPSREEDNAERVFSSPSNAKLKKLLTEHYKGRIVYHVALGCHKAKSDLASEVEACRPYVKGVIDEVNPDRILCFGQSSYLSVLGDSTHPSHCRRGYGYLEDGTPVFMLSTPQSALPNRFLRKRFVDDVLWALSATPDLPAYDLCFEVVRTNEDARYAVDVLKEGDYWVYDTETAGIMGSDYFDVICLVASNQAGDRLFLWDHDALRNAVDPLHGLLQDEAYPMLGHNLKFDMKAVSFGIPSMRSPDNTIVARGVYGDSLLWEKLLDSDTRAGLAKLATRVGMGGHKSENEKAIAGAVLQIKQARSDTRQPRLPGFSPEPLVQAVRYKDAQPKAFAYGLVPKDILHRYCALDTLATAKIANVLRPQIEDDGPNEMMNTTFLSPSTYALAQVEAWGMAASETVARLLGKRLQTEIDEVTSALRDLGCTININSDDQLADYLFNTLKLPVQRLTDTGKQSTDADSLMKLEGKHPAVAWLLQYSKLSTLKGTFVDGLLPHIYNGRIHGNINQDGARSGRWSMSNPNLQNIPSRGAYAKLIKSIFAAPPGRVIIQLDYSQLELRAAALLTGDETMTEAFSKGLDLHKRTAELISEMMWNIPPSEVTKEHRAHAKTFGFGVWYGKSDQSMAKELGISKADVAKLRFAIMGKFQKAEPWIESQKAFALEHGYTWTYWDGELARKRNLFQVASYDDYTASSALRASFNTPIQGSAALYMERTISAVVSWIKRNRIDAKVVNTVHDSIIIEAADDVAVKVAQKVKAIMESWPSGDVPLVADVDIGRTWGDLMGLDNIAKAHHAVDLLGFADAAHTLGMDTAALQRHLDIARDLGVA